MPDITVTLPEPVPGRVWTQEEGPLSIEGRRVVYFEQVDMPTEYIMVKLSRGDAELLTLNLLDRFGQVQAPFWGRIHAATLVAMNHPTIEAEQPAALPAPVVEITTPKRGPKPLVLTVHLRDGNKCGWWNVNGTDRYCALVHHAGDATRYDSTSASDHAWFSAGQPRPGETP